MRCPLTLQSSYATLPAHFYSRLEPTRVAAPRLIKFNAVLAAELGLDTALLDDMQLAAIFSGNLVVPDSAPLAMAYAGHQFGHFVPQLGDGRAVLLGDVRDRSGRQRDIQLKGSGRTPYSRSGDGRAALGPVLREYLVSESMHALGVPTTRALAAVVTGEMVYREAGALPGAVLTRVAASHVRVGTFQYFAARGDVAAVRRLCEYVIEHHYPEVRDAHSPALELLRGVVRRQARLIAAWMHLGFIHGVMNTDNMSVAGETIDFGPCAFMDAYDPATVFSSIDGMGRYAYANQPAAAQWNLARFAETLLPCIDEDETQAIELATAAVQDFSREYADQWLCGMRRKLGLFTEEEADGDLAQGLLDTMHEAHADFTLTFRALCAAAEGAEGDEEVRRLFAEPAAIDRWLCSWRARLAREPQPASEHGAFMRLVNPLVIPRNHRVEAMIAAAVENGDYAPFEELQSVLSRPFEAHRDASLFTRPPRPEERVLRTFCGT